ncbi:MAG TPA: tryptophan--tRNA ligase, partial [Clostridia bacterium]|nr:tryptophan--tRNA ligase [Clostridia bacterium]
LLTILSAVTDKEIPAIEKEFEGKGYAEFKNAVGDAVVEFLRPIQAEYNRLIADKAYLMQVAKSGAQKASSIACKTLAKVYRKVGLVEA